MKRHLLRTWSLGAALASAGCFNYVDVEPSVVPVGNDIKVELTRVGFAQLPELPSYSGPDLSGTVVRADADGLLLAVPVAVRQNGLVSQTIDQQVSIPRGSIVQVQRRVLDRPKTYLAVGGGLATLAAVFLGFKAGGNDTPEIPQPPGEEEAGSRILAPIFSLPLRLLP